MIDLQLLKIAFRDITRPKKVLAALLLCVAPALLVWLVKSVRPPDGAFDPTAIYSLMSEKFVFGFVMVILSVIFCTSVVAQEVENKTIVYLLTRPIPRYRILTVKFIPPILATLATVWASLTLTAIAAYGLQGIMGTALARDLAITPVGVLAYGALFLLLSTLMQRPLIFGLLYTFGWETWVPNMPGSFQKLSLMAYMRVLAPHKAQAPDEVDITQAISPVVQDVISRHFAWMVMLGVIVGAFALALYAFSVREYVPRDAE